MSAGRKSCFTKDQLFELLKEFTVGLLEPDFEAHLASLGQEEAIENAINLQQAGIIRRVIPGIPPQAVFNDLGMATMSFPNDSTVLSALANISLAEEKALNKALKTETSDDQLIQISPDVMRQVQEQAHRDPDGFKKQQEMLGQVYSNADAAEKLNAQLKVMAESDPAAYAKYTQTLAAAAFFAPPPVKHEHNHDNDTKNVGPTTHTLPAEAADTIPHSDNEMPLLQDMDDDLEDTMN